MAGQGSTIRSVAGRLHDAGWTVLFVCVPNTPHVGVVPIPTTGAGRQRYTDIVATRGAVVRLIEVELSLSDAVAEDIAERLSEQRAALRAPATWVEWSARVTAATGGVLPTVPIIECELIVVNKPRRLSLGAKQLLAQAEVLLGSPP